MTRMPALLLALLVAIGLAASPPAAAQFTPVPLTGCLYFDDVHIDEAGSIFTVCRTGPIPPAGALEFDIGIFKTDRTGRSDVRWGGAGLVRVRAATVCLPSRCQVVYSAPARDGGFWMVISTGRVIRFRPDGAMDSDYAALFDDPPGSLAASIPDPLAWPLVGIAQQPDGGLLVLSEAMATSGARRTLLLRRLHPDGRFGGETYYDLSAPAGTTIASWSAVGADLQVLMVTTDGPPAPLVRHVLSPDGSAIAAPARIMPAFEAPGFIHPSFQVLGDGRMMYATPRRIYRWRADGTPDPGFGLPMDPGSRSSPGLEPYFCNLPGQTPHLGLRAQGDVTHHYNDVLFVRGAGCFSVHFDLLANDGRDPNSYGSGIRIFSLLFPSRIDREGGIVYPGWVIGCCDGPRHLVRSDGPGPAGSRARADVRIVEYYHPALDHYFITATENEVDVVDRGLAGAGWKRTGHGFGAFNVDTPMPGTGSVCRFYGDGAAGPNSHFYSAERFECDILRGLEAATLPGKRAWRFEREAFRIGIPAGGKCADNLVPIYRLYNRGVDRGVDSNHRYVGSALLYAEMQARGWVGEGVHMCATRL